MKRAGFRSTIRVRQAELGLVWPVRNWGAEEAGGGAFYPSGSESLGQPTIGFVALSHRPIFCRS